MFERKIFKISFIALMMIVIGLTMSTNAFAAPPVASDSVLVTNAGVSKSSRLSASGGTGTLSYSKVADSVNGLSLVNPDGSYGYLPNANFSGTDSFTYAVTDSAIPPLISNTATVTITVLPVANAGTLTTTKNTFKIGTLTALGKAALTYTVIQPANGAVVPNPTYPAFKYTPNANYTGADSFTFSVKDANGLSSAAATIAVTVNTINTAPTVTDGTLKTRPGEAINGKLTAADVDGDTLTYVIVTPPTTGTVVPNTTSPNTGYPNFTYTPGIGIGATTAATDTFTYKANDGTSDSATNATVTVTISPLTTDTFPVANNGTASGAVGQPISGVLNGTDAENDLLSYFIVTDAKCGDVILSNGNSPDAGVPAEFMYLPRLDKLGCNNSVTGAAGGTDTFTYKVNERAVSPTFPESTTSGTITINITPVCMSAITAATMTTSPAATTGTISVATGGSVTFTETTIGAASRMWIISDASGNTVGTGSVTPFTYAFATVGTYTVTLISSDSMGCVATQSASVKVQVANCNPTAVILTNPVAVSGTVTIQTQTVPQTVTFTNATSGAATQTWSMKDSSGNTITLLNPTNSTVSYTFAAGQGGIYTVTLTTTMTGCTTPSTATVTVMANATSSCGLTAAFTSTQPTATVPTVDFDASASVGAASYSWYFGDSGSSSNTATGVTASHVYSSGGTYYVGLTITDATGRYTQYTSQTVTVTDTCADGITADFTSTPAADPLTVSYSATATSSDTTPLSYDWLFDDGQTGSGQVISHTYATTGYHSATLTVKGCRTVKVTRGITLTCPTPVITPPATVTIGTPAAFTATGGASFNWNFGDTTTDTGASVSHTFTAAGTYTVTLSSTGSGGCPTQIASKTITVNCDAAPSITPSATTVSPPYTTPVSFTAGGTGTTPTWNFGDPASGASNTAAGASASHLYSTPGRYPVTLTTTGASGCKSSTSSTYITVSPYRSISLSCGFFCSGLNFGNVVIGASRKLSLTISNYGDSPLTVSSITYPPGFTGDSSVMMPIAAGSSLSVNVTFTPTAVQSYSGMITVVSDATDGKPATISVSGMGAMGAQYDAARDFSAATSLNGTWSYGYSDSYGFTRYTTKSSQGGVDRWLTYSTDQEPVVMHNPASTPVTFSSVTLPAGTLMLHPGISGQKSVVRWTAPMTGKINIAAKFTHLESSCSTTSDFAILLNSTAPTSTGVWSGNITYNAPVIVPSQSLAVTAGDMVDFAVGNGGDGYYNDSTGVDVQISYDSSYVPPVYEYSYWDGGGYYEPPAPVTPTPVPVTPTPVPVTPTPVPVTPTPVPVTPTPVPVTPTPVPVTPTPVPVTPTPVPVTPVPEPEPQPLVMDIPCLNKDGKYFKSTLKKYAPSDSEKSDLNISDSQKIAFWEMTDWSNTDKSSPCGKWGGDEFNFAFPGKGVFEFHRDSNGPYVFGFYWKQNPPAAPVVPSDVKATAEDGQVTISWNSVIDADVYIVSYKFSGSDWMTTGEVSDTSKTITGLTNGTVYSFAVQAKNYIGTSSYSVEVSATPESK